MTYRKQNSNLSTRVVSHQFMEEDFRNSETGLEVLIMWLRTAESNKWRQSTQKDLLKAVFLFMKIDD